MIQGTFFSFDLQEQEQRQHQVQIKRQPIKLVRPQNLNQRYCKLWSKVIT